MQFLLAFVKTLKMEGYIMERNKELLSGLQAIVTGLAQQADGHVIQSRIFASQGFSKLADRYAEHAEEERGYVKQCIDRLIDLGGEVKLEAKPAADVYKDPVDWLKYDLQVSKDGLSWLKTVINEAKDDYTTYDILVDYYKDEEEDMYWGEQQLEQIEAIGKQNWLRQQL